MTIEEVQLEEQIKVVAEARCKAQTLKEMVSELRDEWEKYNAQTLDNLTQAGANVAIEEDKLRELTLQIYEQTGNKAPAEGVSVKIFQTLDYDPKRALKWALSHQIALNLDKKTFETFAKITPLEFVLITEEPRAQIATNLSK